jgi:putative transposase
MLSDALWDEVSTCFENKERKRKHSLQLIVSALLYLLKTGCQWRMLPLEYGKWQLVYYYYQQWMRYGVLESLLYELVRKVRLTAGRTAEPTAAVIDTQSVKNAAGVSQQVGYDGGKKIRGRKRSLATDTMGTPIAVGVSTAGRHDSKAVCSLKEEVEDYASLKVIFADGAFKGVTPFDAKGRIKWRVVNKKAGPFKVLPKRWVVERTLSWLSNFRRLSKDYEKSIESAKAMLLLASIFITLNKLIT